MQTRTAAGLRTGGLLRAEGKSLRRCFQQSDSKLGGKPASKDNAIYAFQETQENHVSSALPCCASGMVCFQLELRPGLVVLESGTGSASLTHSLGRAVAPTGHVWTYEFHPERAQEAQKELTANGMGSVATVTQVRGCHVLVAGACNSLPAGAKDALNSGSIWIPP